jgi:hypothetical protein
MTARVIDGALKLANICPDDVPLLNVITVCKMKTKRKKEKG